MKNVLLLLLLFVFVFCSDYRKPSHSEKKCLLTELGLEQTKKLLASLRKYHRVNGKATLLDYILDKRPELKEVSDKCLLKIGKKKRRNLDKLQDAFDNAMNDEMVNYYLKSILRDEQVKNELISELKKGNKEAINACKNFLPSDEICKLILTLLAKSLEKRKIQ